MYQPTDCVPYLFASYKITTSDYLKYILTIICLILIFWVNIMFTMYMDGR